MKKEIFDNHIHIGRFFDIYYDAKTVFTALRQAGVYGCFYSSTTSGETVDAKDTALQLYQKIKEEIIDAQKTAASLNLNSCPLYWIIPLVHRFLPELKLEKAMSEAPYKGFKLHPRANIWDISEPFTRALAESAFIYADKKKLPILIHTGYDHDRADIFEPFFRLCTNGKIILAHCRPLDTTLRLLAEYDNVFSDTAFVPPEIIKQINEAGFKSKVLFGSDFPITDYFNNNRQESNTPPNESELCRHYIDTCFWMYKGKDKITCFDRKNSL